MPYDIFSRTTDPVVFNRKMGQLQDKRIPHDRRCAIKKELMAALPYVDEVRRGQFSAYLEKNGTDKDKRRLSRKLSQKRSC